MTMISFSNTTKVEHVSKFEAIKVKDNLYCVRNTSTETIDGVVNGDPYIVEFMCDKEALEWYKKSEDSNRAGWVSDSALIMIDEDKVREQAYNTVNSRSFDNGGIAHSNVFDHFLAGGSSDSLIIYHSDMGMYMDDQGNYLAQRILFNHDMRVTDRFYDLENLSEILNGRSDIKDFIGPENASCSRAPFTKYCEFCWWPSQEDFNKVIKLAIRLHEEFQESKKNSEFYHHSHPILYMNEAIARLDILGMNAAWIYETPLVDLYKKT